MPDKQDSIRPSRSSLFRNWFSLAGAILATGSVFACLFLFALQLFVPHGNPYAGILIYILAPVFFFSGVALVLAGVWLQRHQKPVTGLLVINLSRQRDRKMMGVFTVGGVIFLLCTAIGSYQTYQYTDSIQFCGTACHVPMKPEYTTYLQSPHARVACAECHIGSGATWFVRSKLSGSYQVYSVMFNKFPRPITTPIPNLRPARETCEECHWPQRFIGDINRTLSHYLSDESNSPFAVRLEIKVGGGQPNGSVSGIHWHVSRNFKVEYLTTDTQRQVIPWVRVTDVAKGTTTVFKDKGFHDDPAKYPLRTMDCLDCHTRPSHRFVSPDEAVDTAITAGLLDPSVPWLKSNVVAVLVQPYKTTDEALQKIAASLHASYPNLTGADRVVAETRKIYQANFFPEMNTDWRAHEDNIGHKISAGCFRCHDGNHTAEDGKQVISASCNLCHVILAQGSGPQLQQLNAAGNDFFHIDSVYTDPSCSMCHTGGQMASQ